MNSFPSNTKSPLPFPSQRLISLWDMQQYPTEKLVHVLAAIAAVKDNLIHWRARGVDWPHDERTKLSLEIRRTMPLLDELGLDAAKAVCEDLAQGTWRGMNFDHVEATVNAVRTVIESQLKARHFFVISPDHINYYGNPALAGQKFADNWLNANEELSEAGKCFALDRYTACACHRDTVLAVLEVAGRKSAALLDAKVRNHPFQFVQVDELFAFVHCKERKNTLKLRDIGEQYTFIGVDHESRFIVNYTVGKRDSVTCQEYMQDLQKRVRVPFQLSTDGFGAYPTEVEFTFLNEIHFGQVIKEYLSNGEADNTERRYSPPPLVRIRKRRVCGTPCPDHVSMSYVERTNLSVRLFNRRFTRLTLGYSKKLANLKLSVALLIAHFNFCRVHSTHSQTPAQACGLADHVWTIEELFGVDAATI